jgi:hypothetical protein
VSNQQKIKTNTKISRQEKIRRGIHKCAEPSMTVGHEEDGSILKSFAQNSCFIIVLMWMKLQSETKRKFKIYIHRV